MDTLKKPDGFPSQTLYVLPEKVTEDMIKHPLIQPLYLTDIGLFPRARFHYRERPSGCGSHILMLCTDGKGWFSVDGGRKTAVGKDQLVLLPEGRPHAYGADESEPWSIYWLHLKGDRLPAFIGDVSAARLLQLAAEQSARIRSLFHECFGILEQGYFLTNLAHLSQVLAHLLGTIFLYQSRPSRSKGNAFTVERAIQIMNDHMETTLTLEQLTKQLNMSKPHLLQQFRKYTGYSPIDYYLRLKIQRACQYLDLTDDSVKLICGKLGFADPYYFSRVFRKVMGISPSRYRHMEKG